MDQPQAFPHYPAAGYAPGMTLRDYFATQAMAAMLSTYPCFALGTDVDFAALAGDAYTMADAMLDQRTD